MKKLLAIFVMSLFLFGCAGKSKVPPSFTFKLSQTTCKKDDKDCTATSKLSRHPTSAIETKEGTVIRLSVENAYMTELDEKSATSKGEIGNRELMLYAMIYKNGQFLRYKKITDLAEHMAAYQPVVIQNPIFFTETIDANYHIILKGYEVDTKTLVKGLRRVRSTDVDSIEKSTFSPGDTFTTGLKDVVFGVFDMVLSVTGKSLDDWAANLNATKAFEHSIYITGGLEDKGVDKLLILGSGKVDNELRKEGFFAKPDARTDKDIDAHVKTTLTSLESEVFNTEDLVNGKDSKLSKAPYLILKAERLQSKKQE